MTVLQAALATAVLAGTPLLYAALGEMMGEKVGLLNIGLEGMMLMGAVVGFIVAIKTDSLVLGLLAGGAAGTVFTLVAYTFPVVVLRSEQGVVGFAVWFIGVGLSAIIGTHWTSRSLESGFGNVNLPLLDKIPFVGKILFEQPWPVYAGVLLAIFVAWGLGSTRHGMNMRAIGEDPDAAHAMGINVPFWQVFYSGVSGFLCGVGGAVLTLAITLNWNSEVTAGRGWIALALVIFAGWRPLALVWASFGFGACLMLAPFGQAHGWAIPSPFLSMIPYVFTFVVLVIRTWYARRSGRPSLEPAALGVTFVRERR
ncbi:MAG: ABC transporter permease [Actinobacteria bacterium]|nr:ABC transporter permease [Actinomycetota bacterium]